MKYIDHRSFSSKNRSIIAKNSATSSISVFESARAMTETYVSFIYGLALPHSAKILYFNRVGLLGLLQIDVPAPRALLHRKGRFWTRPK